MDRRTVIAAVSTERHPGGMFDSASYQAFSDALNALRPGWAVNDNQVVGPDGADPAAHARKCYTRCANRVGQLRIGLRKSPECMRETGHVAPAFGLDVRIVEAPAGI